MASVELGYFGEVLGRPADIELPWFAEDAEPNADMWATPDQSRAEIVDLYRRSWQLADETITTLPLDAPAHVPWWGDKGDVTLHRILVHMIAETHRHAGHADIVRELIDGTVGMRKDAPNMAPGDEAWWRDFRDRVEQAARQVP